MLPDIAVYDVYPLFKAVERGVISALPRRGGVKLHTIYRQPRLICREQDAYHAAAAAEVAYAPHTAKPRKGRKQH